MILVCNQECLFLKIYTFVNLVTHECFLECVGGVLLQMVVILVGIEYLTQSLEFYILDQSISSIYLGFFSRAVESASTCVSNLIIYNLLMQYLTYR